MKQELQIEIKYERPPIYEAIRKAGMDFNPDRTIFAYNKAIYNPGHGEIGPDVIAHESTHMMQQGETLESCDAWWERYLKDPFFRLDQEVEAYAVQYMYLCGTIKDRNRRYKFLHWFAGLLSGPMYGSMITHGGAMKLLKDRIK